MDYFVNGKIIRLTAGQGIFVNSERLHYGFSKEHHDCTFIALVIHPRLFIQDTEVGKAYMQRKFGLNNPDYIVLYPHVLWHKDILDEILVLHDAMHHVLNAPLTVMTHAIDIIEKVGRHIVDVAENTHDTHDQILFLRMTEYIQKHFGEKLFVDDIAASAAISRSKACTLFQRFVRTSPNEYLNNYRIMKSVELLKDTHLSMIEISEYCGFQTPSYFSSVFKKEKKMTPRQFRGTLDKSS